MDEQSEIKKLVDFKKDNLRICRDNLRSPNQLYTYVFMLICRYIIYSIKVNALNSKIYSFIEI